MAKESKQINSCPNCGSKKTNKVSWSNHYCMNCSVEFNKSGKVFTIRSDGKLVDYFVNEFEDCG